MTAYAWTDEDVGALQKFLDVLGIADPTIPLKVWSNESGLQPQAWNRNGNASGLFQLMPLTAKGLGYNLDEDPTLENYRELSVARQLQWAQRFYQPHASVLGSVASFYCVTFIPANAAKIFADSSVLVCGDRNGDPYPWAYASNKGFDEDGKGYITGDDLAAAAERAYGALGQSIAARLAALP
jgi:hypothetical protein